MTRIAVRSIERSTLMVVCMVVGGGCRIAQAQCLEGCKAIHVLTGEATGDQFGWKSNYLGDLNDDGINDFVITAPTNDGGGSNAGRIYVHSGSDGTELWRATGVSSGGQLGNDANRTGDINSDGTPDVIAGGPFSGSGGAVVYSGVDGEILHTFFGQFNGDRFGFRVAGGGDANGDGHPDLLVSATFHDTAAFNAGRVYLYDGTDFSLLCSVDGESSSDEFGSALNFVGDRNNDGRDEFVVGARNAGPTSGGRAYLYSYNGKSCDLVHTFIPPAGASGFGSLFAGGGHDINNDGTPDIYVADFNANRAHVYSGTDFSQLWMLTGDGNGGFGLGEMIDDVNGDDHADLILAAWVSNNGGFQAGKAFVYSGADGSILETFTHDIPNATFGFDAKGLGDVNDDGKADYLITAAWDLNQRGRAYVIAGTIGPLIPDDFNAFRGFYVSGDLGSLLASDDDKLCYEPGIVLNPSEAPITLDFTGTLPNDSPATLDVTIESSANTVGLELTFSFWNYNTESWDVVGVEEQTFAADTVRTFAGTPADHVEAGTGAVRTRYEVRVVSFIFLFPWLDCVDHVFWTTS